MGAVGVVVEPRAGCCGCCSCWRGLRARRRELLTERSRLNCYQLHYCHIRLGAKPVRVAHGLEVLGGGVHLQRGFILLPENTIFPRARKYTLLLDFILSEAPTLQMSRFRRASCAFPSKYWGFCSKNSQPSVESIAQQSPRAVFRLFSRLSTTMGVLSKMTWEL